MRWRQGRQSGDENKVNKAARDYYFLRHLFREHISKLPLVLFTNIILLFKLLPAFKLLHLSFNN